MLQIPPKILEKYEISLLGVGGLSKVFLLNSKLTGSKGVMKIAPINEATGRVLLNEFMFYDKLRHPSIPRVLDYFEENEMEYMIMDLVEGRSLDVLARQGAFNLAEIIALIAKICDATYFLHSHGISHGDIKPSNIMVGHAYSINLIDFGAAKDIGNNNSYQTVLITERYAAPEKYAMDNKNIVESEIFSIGATLYYSLINQKTCNFIEPQGSGIELSKYIASYKGKALGYGLTILRKSLAYYPKDRYKSAKEMYDDLMIWQQKECIHPSDINRVLAR